MNTRNLTFEVGQEVESRSFLQGYRGSWFRCKVKRSKRKKNGGKGLLLEYLDFPDQKTTWTSVYSTLDGEKHLMIRPRFPRCLPDSEMSDSATCSELTVVMKDTLDVGHAVDWWTTSTYWSGRIADKLDSENYKVTLWPPPNGEGSSYVASRRDLRPTLVWDPEQGWMLPQVTRNSRPCARLIRSTTDADRLINYLPKEEERDGGISKKEKKKKVKRKIKSREPVVAEIVVKKEVEIEENVCSNRLPLEEMMCVLNKEADFKQEDKVDECISPSSENMPLAYNEELDSAILDLIELLHKIKFMKQILNTVES